jgi:hypothetical protein
MLTHNTKSAPLDLISKLSGDEVLEESSKYNFKLILLYIAKIIKYIECNVFCRDEK